MKKEIKHEFTVQKGKKFDLFRNKSDDDILQATNLLSSIFGGENIPEINPWIFDQENDILILNFTSSAQVKISFQKDSTFVELFYPSSYEYDGSEFEALDRITSDMIKNDILTGKEILNSHLN
jgi:hypothetical protein